MRRAIKILVLYGISVVSAHTLAVLFPSVPLSGLSMSGSSEIVMYGSNLYGSETLLNLITVIQLLAYVLIPLISLASIAMAQLKTSSPIDFNSTGPTAKQMRNGYIIMGLWIGIPLFPIILVGVFGVRLLGITVVPAFLSPNTSSNFAVLSAPIFLLSIVVSGLTVRFSQHLQSSDGA